MVLAEEFSIVALTLRLRSKPGSSRNADIRANAPRAVSENEGGGRGGWKGDGWVPSRTRRWKRVGARGSEQDYKPDLMDADTEPNRNIDLRVNVPRGDTLCTSCFMHNSP